MSSSFSGTRFAGGYFTAQALLVAAWWLSLLLLPATRELFVPEGAGEADLLAFFAPDLLLVAPASLAAGIACLRRSSWSLPLGWLTAGAIDYAFFFCVGWSLLRDGAWLNVALMAPAALLSTVAALDVSAGAVPVFRRASSSPPARHVASTLAQIVVFWTFFLFVVPFALRWVELRLGLPRFAFAGQPAVAGVLFLACSALGLASGITMAGRGDGTPLPFAAPNRLVVDGPYAYLRNPMVVAGLGQGLAVGLWLGSWTVLGYALLGGLLWQLLVRPAEERDLATHFGRDYAEYRARVACWIPRLRRRAESG